MVPNKDLLFVGGVLAILGCLLELVSPTPSSDPPAPPREKLVRAGGSVSIPCPLSTPGGSVQWLRDGEPVVLEPGGSGSARRRHWSIGPDGTPALTISDARASDAGRWECRELAADGATVRRLARVLDLVVGSLSSTGSPSDPYLELEGRRLAHQATVTAREPQRLSLRCVVTGAVPPVRRIFWSIGEANLTSASELFVEFSAEDDAYTSRSVITLNVTRRVHRKELVCQVQHITWLQAAAVSASINVLYDPSFSISREPGFGFPLLEGMRVSLRCEVDANPDSAPLWVKDDGPLTVRQDSGGFLNFSDIGHEHAGWYRCTTHHEFGSFASFGYFLNVRTADLPVSTATGSNIPSGVGQPVGLGCLPDGRPEVTAVNRSLLALAGKSALLAGQLCASPPPLRILWVLRRLALSPGDVHYPYIAYNVTETEMPNCYMSSLEIRSVSAEDAGELLLIVKNARGIADARFIVNVTQASFSVSAAAAPDSSLRCCATILLLPLCLLWLRYSVDLHAS